MTNTTSASIDKKAINEFKKDLLQMLRLGKEMDRYYAESKQDAAVYTKKFKSLIEIFNKKYKNLKLELVRKTNNLHLKIFLNEKSIRDCFANSASKIIGLQSVGTFNFGTAIVSNQEEFTAQLEKAKNKLYITYYSPRTGKSNVFLLYDKKEKKVELVYELGEIENEPSAEFQLAAYYALSKGYNKKINLHDEGATLGFSEILSHVDTMKYYEKFDPDIGE